MIAPSGACASVPAKTADREPAGPSAAAPRVEPRADREREREHDRDPADHAVPELDVGVVALLGNGWPGSQPGQCSQPSPELVSRTIAPGGDDQARARTVAASASRRKAVGRELEGAQPRSACGVRLDVHPRPSRTQPGSQRSGLDDDARRPPRRARRGARRDRGRRTRRRARRPCRPGARRAGRPPSAGRSRARAAPPERRRRRRGRRRTPGCAGRRPSARRRARPRAPRRAPARTSASSTSRTPLRSAVSYACPSRPKPVTSVTAFGRKGRSTSAQSRFSVVIQPTAAPHIARRREAARGAVRARAPSRAASSGRARRPAGRPTSARRRPGGRCRRRRARTSAPRRGSCDRRRGSRPPRAPAGRRRRGPPRRVSCGSSSGNSAIESASSGRPPIANTSLSAFVAAIVPKSLGSSTSGGKKSSVKTSARLGVQPVDGGVVGGREPDEQVLGLGRHEARRGAPASRAAGYFAAHPPEVTSSVSFTATTQSYAAAEARRRPCGEP